MLGTGRDRPEVWIAEVRERDLSPFGRRDAHPSTAKPPLNGQAGTLRVSARGAHYAITGSEPSAPTAVAGTGATSTPATTSGASRAMSANGVGGMLRF